MIKAVNGYRTPKMLYGHGQWWPFLQGRRHWLRSIPWDLCDITIRGSLVCRLSPLMITRLTYQYRSLLTAPGDNDTLHRSACGSSYGWSVVAYFH